MRYPRVSNKEYVYTLHDRDSGELRYVGKTGDPAVRAAAPSI